MNTMFQKLASGFGATVVGIVASSAAHHRATATVVEPPFRVSTECALCHDNVPGAAAMRDSANRPIAPFDLWRSSMMGNAGRDPYWKAAASAEIAATPARKSEIFAKCMRCHLPMASPDSRRDTEFEMSFELLERQDLLGDLARDGVSCTVCHTIATDGLGAPRSYSGHFQINTDSEVYGPHGNLRGTPMVSFTQLTPVTSGHIRESALCATCHTLFTNSVNTDGTGSGAFFPEQMPYLEWRNSVYNDEIPAPGPQAASCQDCHVPQTDANGTPISTAVVHNPGGGDYPWAQQRSPYGRHIFVGGNTFVPQILRDNAVALGVMAPAAAFDATIAAARDQLQNRTADVTITSASRSGSQLQVDVRVDNRCGHKFPSAYPSRRAWLRLTVRDAANAVVFQSGAFDSSGRLLSGNGQVQPFELTGGPVNVHRDLVQNADQVQTWDTYMEDAQGQVTWRLLQAASYRKDNRLLPLGWTPSHPDAAHTMPAGTGGDTDFVAGSDRVSYDVNLPTSTGPFTVEAEVFYQSIAPRHVAELGVYNTPEILAFIGYWGAADKTPERVGGASAVVP